MHTSKSWCANSESLKERYAVIITSSIQDRSALARISTSSDRRYPSMMATLHGIARDGRHKADDDFLSSYQSLRVWLRPVYVYSKWQRLYDDVITNENNFAVKEDSVRIKLEHDDAIIVYKSKKF